ncbi:hypothetical protein H6P81_016177 [Aristolochia fimbriata]|uniref:Integrase catalytic domain-containing protein n=1 Tax=Aristolochia fimbriata TaxID=158543 RepID=A0AAV7EBD1_ARIFI|nr:hypothetical protein H6P81_016177 [Aristolochia fimbriata]
MKKDTTFEWDESCWNAFNNIKAYLTNPPVLVAPIVGKPLLLYISAQEKSIGALLAQCDEDNKERSLYYLSRTPVGTELNYTPIEKTCLALIFVIQKLRHYLLAHSTNLISRADPLKYIMSQSILSGRLAKWALLLSNFQINFVPQRATKGQALANFLADHPVSAEWELTEEFPDEEIFLLKAEYQAILLGLGMAVEMKLPQLNIYGDSALIIKQLTGEFETDALAAIAASLAQFDERPSQVPICERWVVPPPAEEETKEEQIEEMEESFPISANQNEGEDWRVPISNFLRYDTLLVDLRERVHIRRAAPKYVFINDVLYRRSYEGLLLRCLSKEEGLQVLKETHGGICGAHQPGPKVHLQVKRLGYYWPSMLRDATKMARTCRPSQLHTDYIPQPTEPLHPTITSWSFEAWGMDIIGPITPKSDSNRQYILAATDYFSKWAEAAAYREGKAITVVYFIRTQIIYRYGVPRYIQTDNGTPFRNRVTDRFCEKFCILQRTSSAYNPAANGLAEAFNKML